LSFERRPGADAGMQAAGCALVFTTQVEITDDIPHLR
jgi:hypothetical protein